MNPESLLRALSGIPGGSEAPPSLNSLPRSGSRCFPEGAELKEINRSCKIVYGNYEHGEDDISAYSYFAKFENGTEKWRLGRSEESRLPLFDYKEPAL